MTTTALPRRDSGRSEARRRAVARAAWPVADEPVLSQLPDRLQHLCKIQPPARGRGPLKHPLHRHRACTPETAPTVEALAMIRPDFMPRYHPEGRGPAYSHVGVRSEAPEGAYGPIPVWSSRLIWVKYTVPRAAAMHPGVLYEHGVSVDLLCRWAAAKSAYAWTNGRRCVVKPSTLASVLGISERQVQRLNACARDLGLEVVVVLGRMLNQEERWQAHDRGSRQRGLATETALTIPRDQRGPVDHVTPPRGGYLSRKPYVDQSFRHGLTAEKKEAAPRPQPQKGRRRGSPAWNLACQVTRHVPWLAREAPQRLVGALTRFSACPTPWTGRDVAVAIAARDRRLMQPAITTDRITTRPAVILAAVLRDLDPIHDHPSLHDGPLVPLGVMAAEPCGRPDCDGHGWLRGEVETTAGYLAVKPCPHCPPAVRAN